MKRKHLIEGIEGSKQKIEKQIFLLAKITNRLFFHISFIAVYGKSLETELMSETSGNFKRLLVSLCAGHRDESGVVDHEGEKFFPFLKRIFFHLIFFIHIAIFLTSPIKVFYLFLLIYCNFQLPNVMQLNY